MLEAADEGTPPIKSCSGSPNAMAHWQLDSTWPKGPEGKGCAYPQIQLLDEIHREFPKATFLLVFRPVDSWINSALGWGRNLVGRWSRCQIPGLRHYPHDGILSKQDLYEWWCSHVHHMREFVKHHPSHPLIELDLTNRNETAASLAAIFQVNESCWGVSNQNDATQKAANMRANSARALQYGGMFYF